MFDQSATPVQTCPFAAFRDDLAAGDVRADLGAGLIGKGVRVPGPFGERPLIYADYIASGRALMQVERFVMERVLPFYANSHTEASFCGGAMTALRRAARAFVAAECGAGAEHAVVFCGAGATAGLNRLVHLFGLPAAVARGARPLVILGPYEHHSNILPWRESGAEVAIVPEAAAGGPDMVALALMLAAAGARPVVGAFSAASNITGQMTDVVAVTRMLRAAGARVVWDYAGAAPYLPIRMTPAPDAPIDAIALSPHKFPGGPGASGVLVVRRDAVAADRPTVPGGGTVRFVSATGQDYAGGLEAREEGGTPNVVGDIRAGLAFAAKAALGAEVVARRCADLAARGQAALAAMPGVVALGLRSDARLPFLSFRVRDGAGGFVHHQLVTRMLSDLHGVQARGGCACAGPYAQHLLGYDAAGWEGLRAEILAGDEMARPGFVRLNLSPLADEAEIDAILSAVADVAARAPALAALYEADPARAIFRPRAGAALTA